MNNYYIYIYLDPRKYGKFCCNNLCFLYEPFYVGKESNYRWKENYNRTIYFKSKINKIKNSGLEPIIFKLYENLSEDKSLETEKQLIKEIGRIDLKTGPLINMTDGGEGQSGLIHKDETKRKINKSNKGKLSGKNNPMFGIHRYKENSPNFGKKYSEEIRNKMSEKSKGKNNSNHKLKDNEVWLIKKILNSDYYKSGKITQKFIGKMFDISQDTISNIKTKKTWVHIKYEGEN